MEASQVLVCPECGSKRVFLDGFRPAPLNAVSATPLQRYRCADYGHRWSEKAVLNTVQDNKETNHVSANIGAKNMVSMQKTKTCMDNRRTPTANEIKAAPQLERLTTQLFNDGKDKLTIRNYKTYLSYLLINGADLFDPESTKAVLAKMPFKKRTKCLIVSLLKTWFDYNGIFWKPPTYSRESEVPFIPQEAEIDELIAALSKTLSIFCQILKDTGARAGEITKLKWTDIDFKTHTVNIKAEKKSNGRVLPLSDKTMNMLCNLKRKRPTVFTSLTSLRSNYNGQRRLIAEKIANPNILKIHFHTFRHWKATSDLHKYHDRERVQIILGHKSPTSTETYVHIDKMLYLTQKNDDFTAKVADTLEEVLKLVEAGYEFHVEIDGHKIFRKRK